MILTAVAVPYKYLTPSEVEIMEVLTASYAAVFIKELCKKAN
jgi:hypothetical protein